MSKYFCIYFDYRSKIAFVGLMVKPTLMNVSCELPPAPNSSTSLFHLPDHVVSAFELKTYCIG